MFNFNFKSGIQISPRLVYKTFEKKNPPIDVIETPPLQAQVVFNERDHAAANAVVKKRKLRKSPSVRKRKPAKK